MSTVLKIEELNKCMLGSSDVQTDTKKEILTHARYFILFVFAEAILTHHIIFTSMAIPTVFYTVSYYFPPTYPLVSAGRTVRSLTPCLMITQVSVDLLLTHFG